MAEETLYTIGQLADMAGVTPRTIRYYTAEGLLPRPDSRGQYALYSEQHLLRLQLIGRLKATYLPLSEIKAQIEDLDVEQIRVLLEEHSDPPAPASAADYLAQIRARPQPPQPARSLAERAEAYAAEKPTMSVRPPAAPPQAAPAPPVAPTYGFAAPIAAPAPMVPQAEELEAALSPQQPSLLRKLMPQRRARSEPAAKDDLPEGEQRWRRVDLAPGVELHIREPAAPALHERIERLVALARGLFKSD